MFIQAGAIVSQDSLGCLYTLALSSEQNPQQSLPFIPGILSGKIYAGVDSSSPAGEAGGHTTSCSSHLPPSWGCSLLTQANSQPVAHKPWC